MSTLEEPLAVRDDAAEETRRLYEAHRQRIFAYCLGRLGNRADAEDAVQTTFLYVFLGLERGATPRNELPWLFTIAHNACRTRKRMLSRRSRRESSIDVEGVEQTAPEAAEHAHEHVSSLKHGLETLPDRQRRALLLREWQGLSYSEIAGALAITPAAVETLIFRARRNLAGELRAAATRVAGLFPVALIPGQLRRLASLGGGGKATAAAFAVGLTAGAAVEVTHTHEPSHRAPPAAAVSARHPAGRSQPSTLLEGVTRQRAARQVTRTTAGTKPARNVRPSAAHAADSATTVAAHAPERGGDQSTAAAPHPATPPTDSSPTDPKSTVETGAAVPGSETVTTAVDDAPVAVTAAVLETAAAVTTTPSDTAASVTAGSSTATEAVTSAVDAAAQTLPPAPQVPTPDGTLPPPSR